MATTKDMDWISSEALKVAEALKGDTSKEACELADLLTDLAGDMGTARKNVVHHEMNRKTQRK